MDKTKPTITDLIDCAKREIKYRERVYPKLITSEKMTEKKAQ